MRILVMCGGRGIRLRPLTDYMPKSMVPIHGKPFLYYILTWLKKHDIVLSIGYKGEAIRSWCKENKIFVEFVEEKSQLGTGGAVRLAEPFFTGCKKFAVINGDTFIDDLLENISQHYSGGILVVTGKSFLDNVVRPAGIYILNKDIFDYLKRPESFSLDERIKCAEHSLYMSDSKYLDIGSHAGLKYAKSTNIFRGKRWGNE